MSIAFYAPLKAPDHPIPSGDRHMARMLWSALTRLGYRVELASRFRSWEGQGDSHRQHRLRGVGEKLAQRLVSRWARLGGSARPRAWFTYHLYHKAPDWLGPTVSHALGIPYLVVEPSHASKQADGRWAEGYRAAKKAMTDAAALLVVNGNDLDALSRLAIAPGRVHRLRPFLDAQHYRCSRPGITRVRLAVDWELDLHRPWLLCVAMLRPGDKLASYRLLTAALSSITELPWQLVVVGDGAARESVRELLQASIPNRFRLVGLASEAQIRDWLCAADLFVWPAVNEAYGVALLEAQAAGLPVVAGDVGGVADIVSHGVSGMLASAGDTAGMASNIRLLLSDPERRATLGLNARNKVLSEHDMGVAACTLDGVLAQVGVHREGQVLPR